MSTPRTRRTAWPQLEALEARDTPAASGISLRALAGQGVAVIQAGNASASATVNLVPASGATPAQITVSLTRNGATETKSIAATRVTSILFLGGNGNDTFTNNTARPSAAHGGRGNDTFTGGSGRDFFYGDAGDDTLAGNGGADVLAGGAGKDTLTGGAGTDWLSGGPGADSLDGGADADKLLSLDGAADTAVVGGTGRDVFVADAADRLADKAAEDRSYVLRVPRLQLNAVVRTLTNVLGQLRLR